jgi:hypothetical protein
MMLSELIQEAQRVLADRGDMEAVWRPGNGYLPDICVRGVEEYGGDASQTEGALARESV